MRSVLVTMTSFCVQRGEGVEKGSKIAVILKVCPLTRHGAIPEEKSLLFLARTFTPGCCTQPCSRKDKLIY